MRISKLFKGNYEPCSQSPTPAQYLCHLHLMEQRGSGISRMRAAMIDRGLNTPEYSFRDGYFTVKLRGPRDDVNQIKAPVGGDISASIEDRLTDLQRKNVEWLASG